MPKPESCGKDRVQPTYRVGGGDGDDGGRQVASRGDLRRRPRPAVCRPRGRNSSACRPDSGPCGRRDVAPPTSLA